MNLFVSATSEEIQPLLSSSSHSCDYLTLVCGVGCVETTLNLTRFLLEHADAVISRVINIGVAGAFLENNLHLLDLCIAKQETLADFGICYGEQVEPFTFESAPQTTIKFNNEFLAKIKFRLESNNIPVKAGNFLTVNSVSGTSLRGNFLRDKHKAICENMEGFAVARVCDSFSIPSAELRCISNFVEDRNRKNWQFDEACHKLCGAVSVLMDNNL